MACPSCYPVYPVYPVCHDYHVCDHSLLQICHAAGHCGNHLVEEVLKDAVQRLLHGEEVLPDAVALQQELAPPGVQLLPEEPVWKVQILAQQDPGVLAQILAPEPVMAPLPESEEQVAPVLFAA